MKKFFKDNRLVLFFLIGFILVISQSGYSSQGKVYGETAPSSGPVAVVAFTSDVHNSSSDVEANNNLSVKRLESWINMAQDKYGYIDAMGFCGDMARADAGEDYWAFAEPAMLLAESKIDTVLYTTGNHEYDHGDFSNAEDHDPDHCMQKFIEDAEGTNQDHFRIYCLGSSSQVWNTYSREQINKLSSYLNSIGNDKPIFIMTHYPLHFETYRTITNADLLIDMLNSAVIGDPDDATDDKKIVYVWGHNHTDSDPRYDQVFPPGETIAYKSGKPAKSIRFYYAAAGCMSDSEYSVGSGSVKGKGMVVRIDETHHLTFTYHDVAGNDVTKGGAFKEPSVTGISVAPEANVEVGKTVKLTAEVEPENVFNPNVVWSSSSPSVATVSKSGRLRGIKKGKATITVRSLDSGVTATCVVTVTAKTSDQYFVIANSGKALSCVPAEKRYNSAEDPHFHYYGLQCVAYDPEADAPESIRWTLEPVGTDDDNQYYIRSNSGGYLSATYVGNSDGGKTGTLTVGETKDIWTVRGGLDRWELNGSLISSANSTKYLTLQKEANPAMFTVHSEDHANSNWISDLGQPHQHAFGAMIPEKKATCTAGGMKAYYPCQICGAYCDAEKHQTTESALKTSALGHRWGDWKVTRKATVFTTGEKKRVCKNDASHVQKAAIPTVTVSGTLLAKMTSKGSNKFVVSWTGVTGAEGYDVLIKRSAKHQKWRVAKSTNGTTYKTTVTRLKKHAAYRVVVKAYAMQNGKKHYLRTSPTVHAFTSGGTKHYTNPKSVSVRTASAQIKAGKTFRIKASVHLLQSGKKLIPTSYAPKLRYLSSNTNVAVVNGSGKITAKAKGKCTIYVYAANGARKAVAVTVK